MPGWARGSARLRAPPGLAWPAPSAIPPGPVAPSPRWPPPSPPSAATPTPGRRAARGRGGPARGPVPVPRSAPPPTPGRGGAPPPRPPTGGGAWRAGGRPPYRRDARRSTAALPVSRAWHHRAVRPRVILLAICGIAALVYAAGNALDDAAMGRQAGAVAFGALAGYVALAGRGLPPRVRWPLLGSPLVLALGFAVGALLLQAAGPPRSYGFFTYHPLPRPHRASLVRALGRGLSTMAVPLLAYPALAVAVSGLPHRRRPGLLLARPGAAAAPLRWVRRPGRGAGRGGGG